MKNLPFALELVDRKLKSLLPKNVAGVSRLLHSSGKRIRPRLVMAIATASKKRISSSVVTAATAVELVHIASLVHDDIIDGGTLRWGVPTINSREGTDSAILAGDYLFAKGCSLAASLGSQTGQVMAETIAALCEGQARELKDQFNIKRSVKSLNLAIKGKTSSMFIAACQMGGLVSKLDTKQIKILSEFAENFGIAFQYMDDARNFTELPKTAGKSAANDVLEGNYTLPVILSLQGQHKTTLKKLLKSTPVVVGDVYEILKEDESIKKTYSEAKQYKKAALSKLAKLENSELKTRLEFFIESALEIIK